MKTILCLVLVSFALLVPQKTQGCTIPVFRYALEKWELTPYEILVYHRGPLPADVAKELKKWSAAPNKANIDITLIDLDAKMTPAQQKFWKREGDEQQTPQMLVRYLAADPSEASAWRGPCTVANLHAILDSPMRRAILAHLTRGVSIVYILMTSDDAAKDRAALEMVTKELQMLERKIKVPVQSDDGPKLRLPLPLKVSFPVLVLDRNQPEEAAFVRLLLGTEERLAAMKGPIVFPIFGRGRVLGGLTGDEISPDQVMEVAKFLCRECSCQVKELNPGIDMLMTAHWNEMFDQMFEGKEPIAMPAMMPVYLSTRSPAFSSASKAVGVAPLPQTGATPPSKKETPIIVEKKGDDAAAIGTANPNPAPAPALTSATQSQPNAAAVLRFSLWIGIGVASGLVLLTGGWFVYHTQIVRRG